jgi:hypothetical protein
MIDTTLSASEQARLYRACARKLAAAAKAERKAQAASNRAIRAMRTAKDAVARIELGSYSATTENRW